MKTNYKKIIKNIKNGFIERFKTVTFKLLFCHNLHNS